MGLNQRGFCGCQNLATAPQPYCKEAQEERACIPQGESTGDSTGYTIYKLLDDDGKGQILLILSHSYVPEAFEEEYKLINVPRASVKLLS